MTREEFRALELEVESEKLVTRNILEQTRRNGDDLAAVKTRLDRIEAKLDSVDVKGLDRKVDGLDKKVDRIDKKLDALTSNLPRIGDVVREVWRGRDDKR